jgi:hypothetical protein
MADLKLIEEARRILADVTPLEFDCGTLCGNKCCTDYGPAGDTEYGVYLIPGELELYDGQEAWCKWTAHSTAAYDFAPSWEKHGSVPYMMCHKLCNRDRRPFECRTYPLAPFLQEDGRLEMKYAPWACGVCPLTERYQVADLRPAFVAAAAQAWTVLLQDPEMLDHVKWLTEQIRAFEELPHTAPVDDDEP